MSLPSGLENRNKNTFCFDNKVKGIKIKLAKRTNYSHKKKVAIPENTTYTII